MKTAARLILFLTAAVLATAAGADCPLPPGGADSSAGVIRRTNTFRLTRGRAKLRPSAALAAAAQVQACFMARTRTMTHDGEGGSSVGDRVTATGYRWGFIAENVAAGYPSAKSVFRGWRGSAGHRRNMLNRDAREIGIGIAVADGTLYWAMVLGKPLR